MRVITLDSLASQLNVYEPGGALERHVRHKAEEKDTIIMSFAWSTRQQRVRKARVGADCLFS